MIFRTSPYNIADVTLQPHDFDLNGNIRNTNALMCRKVTSIYLPSSKALLLNDALVRSGGKWYFNKPAPMFLALSQIKHVACYDFSHVLSGVSAAPPVEELTSALRNIVTLYNQ